MKENKDIHTEGNYETYINFIDWILVFLNSGCRPEGLPDKDNWRRNGHVLKMKELKKYRTLKDNF